MTVFKVYTTWDGGNGHDNGYYESPLFTNKQLAEDFLNIVKQDWEGAYIIEEEILSSLPGKISSDDYLIQIGF